MVEEFSFVEVLMIQYEPGQTEYQDFLENEVHCFDVSWEIASEEIKEVLEAKEQSEKNRKEAEAKSLDKPFYTWTSLPGAHEPDTLITKPLTAFQFKYMGQSLDRHVSSGLEWEVHSMDAAYVFKDWLDELKKIGQEILADKKAMSHPKAKNVVRFVTLWSYSAWEDSYNHEWDSEWGLIGLVDPKKIFSMLNAENVFKKPKGDLLADLFNKGVENER